MSTDESPRSSFRPVATRNWFVSFCARFARPCGPGIFRKRMRRVGTAGFQRVPSRAGVQFSDCARRAGALLLMDEHRRIPTVVVSARGNAQLVCFLLRQVRTPLRFWYFPETPAACWHRWFPAGAESCWRAVLGLPPVRRCDVYSHR
jgi:hypothetical protein